MAYYGNRFVDMWRDTNIADVKAMWAEKLGGFHDRAYCLKYGLECLGERAWPPTLPEFLSDCRRAPKPAVIAIACNLSDEDLERNKARAKEMIDHLNRITHS